VAAAEYHPLRGDSEELVAKLTAISAPVEFRLWPRITHACLNLTGWVDAMKPEVDRIGTCLRQVTGNVGVRHPLERTFQETRGPVGFAHLI